MQAWHLWIIGGILLIVLEMFTVSFFLASFGVAAMLTAIAAALGASLEVQLAVLAVTSLFTIFGVRPLFKSGIYRLSDRRLTGPAALIGKVGHVTERIVGPADPGRVRLGGEEWRAIAPHPGLAIEPGAAVEVTAVDSATLTVVPRA